MREIEASKIQEYQQDTLSSTVSLRDVAVVETLFSDKGCPYHILKTIKGDYIESNNVVDVVISLGRNKQKIVLPPRCNRMFSGIHSLQCVDLSETITDSVEDISELFLNCKSLKVVIFNRFKNIDRLKADNVFSGCDKLRYVVTKEDNGTYTIVDMNKGMDFWNYIKSSRESDVLELGYAEVLNIGFMGTQMEVEVLLQQLVEE